MKKVFIVTYIGEGDETVETALLKRSDFNKWLKEHNNKRKADGNEPENADEFIIKETSLFTPKKIN